MGIPTLENNIFIEVSSCFECCPGLNTFSDCTANLNKRDARQNGLVLSVPSLNLLLPKAMRQEKFEFFDTY